MTLERITTIQLVQLPEHLTTPEAQAHFDAIWAGSEGAIGFSEADTRARLASLLTMQADLDARRIGPAKVVGGGFKTSRIARKVAVQYLIDQIEKAHLALATNGRSELVNQRNVGYHQRLGTLVAA